MKHAERQRDLPALNQVQILITRGKKSLKKTNAQQATHKRKNNPAVAPAEAYYAQPRSNFSSPGGVLNSSEIGQLIRTEVAGALDRTLN